MTIRWNPGKERERFSITAYFCSAEEVDLFNLICEEALVKRLSLSKVVLRILHDHYHHNRLKVVDKEQSKG